MRLLLATGNAHKLREFERLLPGIELDPLPAEVDTPPEDRRDVRRQRADQGPRGRRADRRAAIADDSGIEAEALGGAPGVRTARYAGEHASDEENLAKFEREVPPGSPLRYVCAIAHVDADGAETVLTGTCEGTMAASRAGARGFGYDPIFVPARRDADDGRALRRGEGRDLHRGNAARALREWLEE